jgi:hypothetical protein
VERKAEWLRIALKTLPLFHSLLAPCTEYGRSTETGYGGRLRSTILPVDARRVWLCDGLISCYGVHPHAVLTQSHHDTWPNFINFSRRLGQTSAARFIGSPQLTVWSCVGIGENPLPLPIFLDLLAIARPRDAPCRSGVLRAQCIHWWLRRLICPFTVLPTYIPPIRV